MASQTTGAQSGLLRPQSEPIQAPAHDGGLLLPAPNTLDAHTASTPVHYDHVPITPHGYLSFFGIAFLIVAALAICTALGVQWFRKTFYALKVQRRTNTINNTILNNTANKASVRLLRDKEHRNQSPVQPPRKLSTRVVKEADKRTVVADDTISDNGAFSEDDLVKKPETPASKEATTESAKAEKPKRAPARVRTTKPKPATTPATPKPKAKTPVSRARRAAPKKEA